MADKQVRVNLVFDADISKAKQSVQELYNTLEKISGMNLGNAPTNLFTSDIQKASLAAAQLKVNLQEAVDTNTGKLDLNKFNKSLQKSNMTLNDYKNILTSCGPAGQKAFVQLAQSVVSADAQVIKLGARVRDLGVTLANTVKWQISSSIIHGISGALSSAYGYAQDLNKSLNNIRIVTGYNIEDMRKFAKEASQAAQALSTTTTQYTDASLIFYQQGLSGEDVKERAEAVIKLASVTGESASQVSNYMTAIWNNFYDGSQSLEHYTDVLTKLGAATASSSDEIAGGLEKFSAIADTIGLSYEYAASALATITAQTRQSEEVVGTALKTIFARIQGLNMGESLEDGVDLNKYSKALQAVGISIFDTTGELKSMNNILDEMGERWGTLSKAEQTALAQTVAGVRQYNQLISLMDNWSTFEVNVDMSLNSDGSMDEQFAIYEESWEASSKRLRQSFEDMYDSIIDEDVFIGLTDFFTNLVKSSTATIDSIGGLKGVITLLGSVMLKVFSPQIGQTLDTIGLKIQRIATGTNKGLNEAKSEAAAMLGEIYTNQSSNVGGIQAVAAENMGQLNEKYLSTVEKLAPYQKQIAESLLQQQNSLNEAVISQGELVKEKQKEYEIEKNRLLDSHETVRGRERSGRVDYQVEGWTDKTDETKNKTEVSQRNALKLIAKKAGVEVEDKTFFDSKEKRRIVDGKEQIEIEDRSTFGFTVAGGEKKAIELQKVAVEEYITSLEKLKLLEDGMFNSTSQVDNRINAIQGLTNELTNVTSNENYNFEDYNKALQGVNFSEIENEIATASNTIEAFEEALNKQGKTLEDVFGNDAAKDIKQYSTQLKQVSDAQKKVAEASSKVANLEKKANTKGLSTKEQQKVTEELAAAKKELTQATQEYTNAVNGNGNAQETLKNKFDAVSNIIKNMSNNTEMAKQALIALGFEEDEIKKIEASCMEANMDFAALVEIIARAKAGVDQFGQQADKLADQSNTAGQKIAKIGSTISQVAMALQAAKGMWDIWDDEDLSTGEKLMSSLMNMAMILPTVGTLTDDLTKAMKKRTAESAKGVAADAAEIASSKAKAAQNAKETATLWSKAIAWMAAHPFVSGAVVAAVITGLGLMASATGKHNKEAEKAVETSKKTADASREKAEASQEELTSVQDLYQEYSELNKVYEQTGEITEDLTKTTTDLVNELDIEGGQLLVLQGEYDTLNEKIRENLKLKAQQNAENAGTSLVDAVDAAEDSLKTKKPKDRDFFISQEEGNQKIGFFGVNQETDSFFLDYLKAQGENTNWKYNEETRQLTADYTDEDQIGQLQDELERMFAAALKEAGGAKTLTDQEKLGFYQTFQRDILNKGDEVTSGAYYGVKDASNQAKESEFERKLYESNVTTIDDYEQVLNDFIDEEEPNKDYLIDQLNNYIKSNSTFANLAIESEILKEQKQRFEASGLSEDFTWEEFIEKYGKDTVLQAKIEPYMDKNSLDNVIQEAQKAADNNAIELKVSAAKTALEGLDDVKTKEDYEAYWDETASVALEGTEWTKDTFAGLSPSEQRRILEKQTRLETQKTTAQDVMAANSERRNAVKAYNDYVSEETKYYENGQKRELNNLSGYGIETSEGLLFENQSGGTIKAEDVTKIGELVSEYAGGAEITEDIFKNFLKGYQQYIAGGYSEDSFIQAFQGTNVSDEFKEKLMSSGNEYVPTLGTDLLGVELMVSDLDGIDMSSLFTQGSGAFDYYNKVKFNQEAENAWTKGDELEASATNATVNYNQTRDDYFVSDYEKEMDFKESLTNLDLDIDEVYNLKEAINDVADESEIFSEDLKDNEDALKEAAKQMTRYGKAVEAASGKMDDWKKALKGDDLVAKTKAAEEMRDVYADMFDLDGENFSKEFLESTKNAELMDKALQGSEEAYNKLQATAAMDIIKNELGDLPDITQKALNEITSQKIEAGDLIDMESTLGEQLGTMYQDAYIKAIEGGKSVAEAMEIANRLIQATGFEPPEFEMEAKTFYITSELPPNKIPQPGQLFKTDDLTEMGVIWSSEPGEKYSYPITMMVPKATSIRKSTENLGGATKKPSGGGGGSKKKTSEARKDKTDVVDRYKEVNDKLEETQRLMDKNNTLADGLWGPDKIALMKENIKLMEKENKYLQEKYDLSKKYLAEDKAALQKAAADVGINFTFNNDDNISNYTEQMTALFNQREALLDSFGEEMDEKEQERLDEFDKKVEALKSAYELYETTLDEKKDLEEEHLEKMLEIQEEYYNVLNEELEVKVSINESDLEVIDYYLNKISDDFYQMAEAAALMVGSLDDLASGKMGGQMAEYFDGLDIQKNYLESLEHDYNTINPETGTTYINQQQYIEGLRESRSEIINNLSAINDLDKEMLDYYANTLSMASDELDKFTSKLEHQTSVLEHYKTIMDVLGKSQDYEAMGIILEGQVTTVENELKVAEETYKLYRSQADDKRELYEQAIAAGDQAAAELYKREWEAAEEAATEAQDNMLSKTEQWAEAMKAKLRNSLDGFADELEKALTGGSSFDYINTQMERAASLQEEYLTTTNKIYETNKLMRKAQQEIDKTTNTVAKQRLKDFIKETDQLQDKSQLSKYELEIQQAKYDLLLAEIALQEAQNAKSTVRLQRDSEGNFGYVYTADQNEIDNAEQALEDAQNNLYNIGLRGATEYVEKYNQTMSAMYDTFRELEEARFNNEISQDEYNQRMLEAQEYYYQELSNFQDLYGIALDADSRVYQDAWTSAFTGMMDSSETWKDKVIEYSENAQTAFEDWATKVDEIAQRTGLDDIAEKVKEVTDDSEELKNTILGDGKKDKGVIGALEEELNAVSDLTEKYGSLRGMIQGLIKDYSGLLTAINNAEHAQAEGIENEPKTEGVPSSTSDSNSKKADETQAAAAPSLTTGSQIQVKPGTRWYEDSFGGGSSGSARGGTISYVNENGSHPYNIEGMGWIKKTDIVGYDTGGYTGSWEGSYGKLAFLHQKELILNAKDTENLLQSMDFLNNIISTIDLYSANAQLGSALMNPYINNTNTKDTLEQRVYIEASFPGVSDHNELEEAFNNLINTASQYANRK